MIGELVRTRYELTELLQEGPVFDAYKAKDRTSGRTYLIRVLRSEFSGEEALVERLKHAVRELSVIRSPHVERLVELVEHDGRLCVLSEAPNGQTLADRIQRLAPYSVPVSMSLTIQILDALSAVHHSGFAHGEVTSSHVMVGQDGKVTLLQPGLWTIYGASPKAGLAVLPELAPYMAPEVSQGKMPSPTSDVYGVGIIFFELLTARQPFSADSTAAMAQKHLTAPIPALRQINPSVPAALEELIRMALSKDPGDRYQNAKTMLSDLRVMQDALRFGRPLHWPVRGGERSSASASAAAASTAAAAAPVASAEPTTPVQTPASVNPNSAMESTLSSKGKQVFGDPKPQQPQKPVYKPKPAQVKTPREELDVSDKLPPFLSWIAYLALISMIVIVGAFVFWNLTKPKPIQVPNLVGMSVADAKQRLADMDLSLRVSRTEFSERRPEGSILELSPRPGEEVRENSFVSAVVSGGSRMVVLPDLRGRSMAEARKLLNTLNLVLDESPDEERSRRFPVGTIIRQIPEARTKLEKGTKIKVTIAGRRERDDPDSRVTAEYAISITMPDGIQPLYVRVDAVDLDGTRTVYPDTKRFAGDEFPVIAEGRGGQVLFKIFFDGNLVKQITARPVDVGKEKQF